MRDHRKQGTNLVPNSYYFFGIVNIIIEEGGLAPYGKIGKANFSYPRLARESGSAASIEGASPLRRLASPILLSPRNVSFLHSSVRAHRAPIIKPPSERSQKPKAWGNWEGIGDFCLQKCQRGRQLSPLSEATRLDRSSLTLASKDYKKKGALPPSAIGFANSPIPRNLIQYARTNNSRFGNWRFGYPLFPNNFAAYKKRFTFFRPRTEFRLYIASAEYRSLGYRIFSVSLSERTRRPTPSNSPHSAGGV